MRALVFVCLAACSFHSPSVGGDAAGEGAIDAPPDVSSETAAQTCEERWRAHTIHFSAPVPIAELNTSGYERDPYLLPDELVIMYSTDRAGGLGSSDVWIAKRPSRSAPFGTPIPMADVNSSAGEGRISMTSDGLLAVVASSRSGGQGGVDVWQGVRGTTSDSFTMSEMHMDAVNTSSDQHDPLISPDGLRLYIAPFIGGVQQLVVATRGTRADDFSSPTPLDALNSGTAECDPAIAFDEHLMVFSSLRNGDADLYYATRAQTSDPFDPPVALVDLNTSSAEGDPWLSADGCRLYYSSYAPGNPDLFVATATP